MMECDLPPRSFNSTGHLSTLGYGYPGRMHHSTSTPAGVDGGGGGLARTPPATPKKGGKMLAIRVQMLDDTVSMFQVQSKALGKVLFDQVCRQLHLLEADYFGLEYQEPNGTKYWLDLEKALCRQVGLSLLEPMLRFCVKFYTPDPARLEEEFTRYLFCLQVKRDLATGCIQCNENTAALMASYIVQAECGDFVPEDYPDHTYLTGYKFCPQQDSELERRIMENHKKHIGQSPAEADLNLLETARRCELYGIKMHSAKDHDNVPLNLAVAHLGIVVFQNCTKINTFSWAKIRKISFKRKRFLIKLHPESFGYYKEVVEFIFEGRNECKNFWKKCVENHGFFRCSSVKRMPRHKTRVISRGSSFRYSGKTQKQIVEFVRENYVKRQTFQRSGSFRASRSLRSSRANVGAPINTSISAHPLLPLPPGSDAISLEWDQQPHYLEASLMMKGYSEREARAAAAAARAGTRRSSEGASRQLHAATTCATMRDKGPPELVTRAEVNHHHMEDSPHPHQMTTPLEPVWTQHTPETMWSQASSRVAIATTTTARDPTPPLLAPEDTRPDSCVNMDVESPSSDSYAVSPKSPEEKLPVSQERKSEVATSCNGLDRIDNHTGDTNHNYHPPNGNIVDVHAVPASSHSMEVLSCGESDAGDSLSRSRLNNNSMSSCGLGTLRDGTMERARRRAPALTLDTLFYITKELILTERTYKSDLEVVTIWWSGLVSELVSEGRVREEALEALGRPCLALEPLALAQAAFLANLERVTRSPQHKDTSDEPEYHRVAELLYDYLKSTYDVYWCVVSRAGALVARLESARRGGGVAAAALCADMEARSPLPLAHHLLRPLHRLLYYRDMTAKLLETEGNCGELATSESHALAARLAEAAESQLEHAENHALLCQLQRDLNGFDKLLVPEREFVRLGVLYKHSSKGLQQRMFFLFSDTLLCCSKAAGGGAQTQQFRVHCVLPLCRLSVAPGPDHLNNSFLLHAENVTLTIMASDSAECESWCEELHTCATNARLQDATTAAPLSLPRADTTPAAGLAHVCWHRATSLTKRHYHTAVRTQLSGYLLRKFKNSHGWQKLWVVLATATLFFYKGWHEEQPLASLPLLGYSVSTPSKADNIHKDFVFKLVFKNHVYFFRAESEYTFQRWTEELRAAMGCALPTQS